jgi:hypothetical protein
VFEKCLVLIVDGLKGQSAEDLTSENQHYFKPEHSTNTATLRVQERIAMAFPRKKTCYSRHN